jgi:hypothetical protein
MNQQSIVPAIPRTISKKELRYLLSRTEKPLTYFSFRTKYFTDDVIAELGFSIEQFNDTRLFDVEQTRRIINLFQIEAYEFE